MNRYKNMFNIVAATIVLVFIAWMFSFATPEPSYTKNWKPKTAMKYQPVDSVEVPMSVKLFGPKSYTE